MKLCSTQKERKKMEDKDKIKRLMELLEAAIYELRNSAADWYQDEVLDLIGTDEEELKELGFSIVD